LLSNNIVKCFFKESREDQTFLIWREQVNINLQQGKQPF
jgi:hypothetical protein